MDDDPPLTWFEWLDWALEINLRVWPALTVEEALADAINFADRMTGSVAR